MHLDGKGQGISLQQERDFLLLFYPCPSAALSPSAPASAGSSAGLAFPLPVQSCSQWNQDTEILLSTWPLLSASPWRAHLQMDQFPAGSV